MDVGAPRRLGHSPANDVEESLNDRPGLPLSAEARLVTVLFMKRNDPSFSRRPDGAQDRCSHLCVEARRQMEEVGDLSGVAIDIEVGRYPTCWIRLCGSPRTDAGELHF